MGFFSWLGFGKPRDAPEGAKTERPGLPEITDNVRDSGQTFFFGTASSGERVDEKSAMQISTVYACVRLLAETRSEERRVGREGSARSRRVQIMGDRKRQEKPR